jgi:uncharacterized protein YegP (UPF0339 family)
MSLSTAEEQEQKRLDKEFVRLYFLYSNAHQIFTSHAYSAKLSTTNVLSSEQSVEWTQSIKDEMQINVFDSGALIEETPSGTKGKDWDLVFTTMQYKVKMHDDG